MADTKISALPAATLPLAGTEVLPIVQGGTTDKVSVANLTAGRAISATQLTLSTGNLIQGTAARGVNFTANTPAAGMTSQLLNWYEEGTWTPADASGASLTFTNVTAKYTRIGRAVTITLTLTYPTTADTSQAKISGLPYAPSDFGQILFLTPNNSTGSGQGFVAASATTMDLYIQTGLSRTNANLTGATVYFTGTYLV